MHERNVLVDSVGQECYTAVHHDPLSPLFTICVAESCSTGVSSLHDGTAYCHERSMIPTTPIAPCG